MPYDPTDWDTADETAKDTAQNFFVDEDGAHISTTPGDPDTGNNTMMDSSGFYVRDGTVPFATLAQPTIIGKTTGPNFRIGTVSPYGDGIGVFNGSSLGLWIWHDGTTGYIQSGDGCYLNWTGGGLYVTPFGQSQIKIADANRRSDFAFGNCHVYTGALTKTVSGKEATIWNEATFKSTFNTTNPGLCSVMISNGNSGTGDTLGATGAEYWTSGTYQGWHARWVNTVSSGLRQFNYIVAVPASVSTV